jgi:hypothetical protein
MRIQPEETEKIALMQRYRHIAAVARLLELIATLA